MLKSKPHSLLVLGCECLSRAPVGRICQFNFTTPTAATLSHFDHRTECFSSKVRTVATCIPIKAYRNKTQTNTFAISELQKICRKQINYTGTSIFQNNNNRAPVRCKSTVAEKSKAGATMNVFDRKAKRLQRDRTTLLEDYEVYDYLKEEVGFRLYDRICDVKRVFDRVVELGCGRGYVSRHITKDMVNSIYQCEMSHKLLLQSQSSPEVTTEKLVVDEEFFPFREDSLDLVVSNLSLHWVNDLPGCFMQVHNALSSDCAFLGSMFGGDTLYQLRGVLQLAETDKEGGFAPHISPFVAVQDLGSLLNRAGFTMLTIDVDEIIVTYPSMHQLMYDLKGMGENNCAWSRKLHLHRGSTSAASALYKEMYGNDQGIPATFQILYFIGWKPGASQTQAAERGSGTVSLKDIDKLSELVKEAQQTRSE